MWQWIGEQEEVLEQVPARNESLESMSRSGLSAGTEMCFNICLERKQRHLSALLSRHRSWCSPAGFVPVPQVPRSVPSPAAPSPALTPRGLPCPAGGADALQPLVSGATGGGAGGRGGAVPAGGDSAARPRHAGSAGRAPPR